MGLRTRTRAALALLLVAVLLGCTSGDEEPSSDDSTTTAAEGEAPSTTLDPEEVAKKPGVTEDAIKVGITYVDLAAVADVVDIDHGDYEAAYTAVIDDLNAKGGINGRMIEPVFAPINPIQTQPAEEACLKLTQDDEVFAVMGFFLGDAVLCPLETHGTAVIGGDMTPERLERAQAPWFSTGASSDVQTDAVRTLAEEGLLDGKLAVFALFSDAALLEEDIEPLLGELGIDPVETAILEDTGGDVAAGEARSRVIAERFQSSGAEKVLVVGNGGVSWATALSQTDYRPENIFITRGTMLAFALDKSEQDLAPLEGAIAADLSGSQNEAYDEPAMEECKAVVEKAIGRPIRKPPLPDGESDQFASTAAARREVTLFAALAEEAGEDLNYATFRAAAETVGPIPVPGFAEPLQFGPPPHADGDPPVEIFEWNSAARTFDPLGG